MNFLIDSSSTRIGKDDPILESLTIEFSAVIIDSGVLALSLRNQTRMGPEHVSHFNMVFLEHLFWTSKYRRHFHTWPIFHCRICTGLSNVYEALGLSLFR